MNAIPFDTLKMARKLEAAGFPGPQAAGAAEAMAEAMSGAELATKSDVLAVKADVQAVKSDVLAVKSELSREMGLLRTDLEREIGLGRSGLEREIGLFRSVLKSEIGLLRSDLEREIGLVRSDLTRVMTAMDTRLSTAILKLGSNIEILRRDMTISLGAVGIASTGIIIAAMRFMLAHP
jgi:hypothetical protein